MNGPAPHKLRPDNFTPPTRTPWGGTRIRSHYKQGLPLPKGPPVVGESWEISVEPSFPSRLVDSDRTLEAVIAADPEGWLGAGVAHRYGNQTPLLVKLLDSADNLSVQVHPADGDPALAADESGKPESWVVLDAEPGAGFYLGFREGVSRDEVARCLNSRGRLDELLNFVPVAPGDAFVIEAGTVHAIGAGVTLVEPQFVSPGRRGVTYRFWDWNRLYDAQGKRSPDGEPRQLHVERSLAVTTWDAPRGEAFVQTCRAVPKTLAPSRELLVDWPWFHVERWSGTTTFEVAAGSFWALTCVGGRAQVAPSGDVGTLHLACGESAVVPAARSFEVTLEAATLVATRSPE